MPFRIEQHRRRRVGIIGGGPGGLAAAMLLAKAGVDVTVHEARDVLGGRSATITAPTAGTFRFDLGPTFFLYPRVLADIFAGVGRRLEDEVELIRLDPQYRLVFEAARASRPPATSARMDARSPSSRPTTRRAAAASSPRTAPSWTPSARSWRPLQLDFRDLGRPKC